MLWVIDPFHTLVEFSVVHLKINIVKGRFKEVQGSIYLNVERPEGSWVKAEVNAASVDTNMIARDGHLRSADFFEVARYPLITFESTRVQQTGAKSSMVAGNLTVHGVTRPVSFQAEFRGSARDPETGNWRIGLFAAGTIDRRVFNMLYGSAGDKMFGVVGNEVRIELHIEAIHM